jgi:hypothetical protein
MMDLGMYLSTMPDDLYQRLLDTVEEAYAQSPDTDEDTKVAAANLRRLLIKDKKLFEEVCRAMVHAWRCEGFFAGLDTKMPNGDQ